MSTSQLIGVVAAAKLLGVHRSTLYLAIQHHDITPDERTPRGHARFTLATIEAYRAQMRDGPAASGARPRLVQLLTRKLAEAMTPQDLAHLAVQKLVKLIPSLSQALVLMHKPELANPWHVERLSSHGVRWQEAVRLDALRGTHEFAYLRVLREGAAAICPDVQAERMLSGTRAYMALSPLRAYILLPLIYGKDVQGVFELGFTEVRVFAQPEVQFYSNIADLLAVAIWTWRQQQQYRNYLVIARDLIDIGMKHHALLRDSGGARMERIAGMLTSLAESYRTTTGAYTVICTAGPLAPGMIEDTHVRTLAEQCANTRLTAQATWHMDGREASGMGTPVSLAGGQAVGIAAGWKLPRAAWPEDLCLLQVLAGACVLGLSSE